MHHYRVTKYDPARRDHSGAYLDDDWTSISDIGRPYDGQLLTAQAYLRVESLYLDAIQEAIDAATPDHLEYTDFEYHGPTNEELQALAPSNAALISFIEGLGPNTAIDANQANRLAQCVLRELCWCKIEGSNRFYVHFGYDYYMYIGGSDPALANFQAKGLFLEAFKSPYL